MNYMKAAVPNCPNNVSRKHGLWGTLPQNLNGLFKSARSACQFPLISDPLAPLFTWTSRTYGSSSAEPCIKWIPELCPRESRCQPHLWTLSYLHLDWTNCELSSRCWDYLRASALEYSHENPQIFIPGKASNIDWVRLNGFNASIQLAQLAACRFNMHCIHLLRPHITSSCIEEASVTCCLLQVLSN